MANRIGLDVIEPFSSAWVAYKIPIMVYTSHECMMDTILRDVRTAEEVGLSPSIDMNGDSGTVYLDSNTKDNYYNKYTVRKVKVLSQTSTTGKSRIIPPPLILDISNDVLFVGTEALNDYLSKRGIDVNFVAGVFDPGATRSAKPTDVDDKDWADNLPDDFILVAS